jgi:hypothetical protein
MKNYLRTFFFLFFYQYSIAQDSINFVHEDLESVFNLAKEQQKLVFLYTYNDNCRYCVYVQDSIFSNVEVIRFLNKHFICKEVNADKDYDFSILYNAFVCPKFIFTNYLGETMLNFFGKVSSKEFVEKMNFILNYNNGSNIFEKLYLNGDKSDSTLYNYILYLSGLNKNYETVLKEYISNKKEEDLLKQENLYLIYIINKNNKNSENNWVHYNSLAFKLFMDYFEELEKNYKDIELYLITRCAIINHLWEAIDKEDIENIIKFTDIEMKYSPKKIKKNTEKRRKKIIYEYYLNRKDWEKVLAMAFDVYDTIRIVSDSTKNKMKTEILKNSITKNLIKNTIPEYDELYYYKNLTKTCYMFYENTSDTEYLNKAIEWVETILKVGRNFDNLKIYALLLHKQNRKKEAKEIAKEALVLQEDLELKKICKNR